MSDIRDGIMRLLRWEHEATPRPIPDPISELGSSGLSSTGNLTPFSYAPRAPLPTYNHQSSSGDYSALPGEIWALKEAGRALLDEFDARENSTIAFRTRDDDVIERFRALVEPKGE